VGILTSVALATPAVQPIAAFRPFTSPTALRDYRYANPRIERSVCVLHERPGQPFDCNDVLAALARGASGVLIVTRPAATRREPAAAAALNRLETLRELLHFIGCDRARIQCTEVSPADGGAYARVLGDFTEQVQGLGSWLGGMDAADERMWGLPVAAGPSCGHASAELSAALRGLSVELLASGRVDAVLGWTQGREEIVPLLARTPAQAARLCAGGPGYLNLAAALASARATGGEALRVAVVVRPQELRSIHALQRDGLLAVDGLLFIGQGVAQESCDVVLAPAGQVAGELVWSELDALEQWSLAERVAFWQSQFANCVHCDGCRSACPFRCYTANVEEAIVPDAAAGQALNPRQTACAQVAAALRLAEHCALCGSCSLSCPQGVPLYLLHQKAAWAVHRTN
jgi:coenzyme F420-reducing hydrogenase delta subunit/ferredoxin